ncbi:hypothetical protein [Peribacillus sp. FSL M8-0224]|uniref:hypothetical protein n=1 Tax=Peribacillus sp. FSL M8-0224 TaxID=2921568 RepID=UPI0030FAEC60
MKLNIQDMRGLIEYINEEHNATTRYFREQIIDPFREKKADINRSRDLSDVGKLNKIAELQKVYERKALELSRDLHAGTEETARMVKQAAEELLISEIKPVDPHKKALFDQKVEKLTADVKFAVTPKRASDALKELLTLADEPALANEVKGKILELSDYVVDASAPIERMRVRKELGDLYNTASRQAMPEGGQEAAGILESATRLIESSGISQPVVTALREVSIHASTFIYNPEEGLATLNVTEPSPQDAQKTAQQESLERLAEKARRTNHIDDRIAYTQAKMALMRA